MKTILAAALVALSIGSANAAPVQSVDAGSFAATARQLAANASKAAEALADAALAKASLSGTFVYSLKISLVTSVPTSMPVICNATVIHSGLGGASYVESADDTGSRTADTVSCTMKIPYLWALANGSGVVIGQITVVAGDRQLSHGLPPIAMPAAGKTTTVKASLRM